MALPERIFLDIREEVTNIINRCAELKVDLNIDEVLTEFFIVIQKEEFAVANLFSMVDSIVDTYSDRFYNGWLEDTVLAEDVSDYILEELSKLLGKSLYTAYWRIRANGFYFLLGKLPYKYFGRFCDNVVILRKDLK